MMRFRPYLYIIKIKILLSLTYRLEVFTSMIGQFVILFTKVLFWNAAFLNRDIVADVTSRNMVDYSVLSVILAACYVSSIENEFRSRIRDGNLALDLLKPVNTIGIFLSNDLGSIISNLIIRVMPIYLISGLIFGFTLPVSATALLFFGISASLGFLTLWLIDSLFALLMFWYIDLGPISGVKNYIVLFLSGQMIPIWFFPKLLQRIFRYMPFMYIYQEPIGIYIGKTSISSALFSVGVQLVWIMILYSMVTAIKQKAFRVLKVQGG